MGNTARGVPYMDGALPASQIDTADQAQAQWINDNVLGFKTYATYVGRPAAAASNLNFLAYVTDARAYFISDGATWFPFNTIESMTTAQKGALVAGGKWDGRVIFDTNLLKHQRWDATAAAWKDLAAATGIATAVFLKGGI